MRKKIQVIPSGIQIVDSAWGGFYRGGTYLLIGPRKSGRTLLGLQYAMECARQKEVCLYFTSMRPKDLMIHAASIDFDLQHYMNQNLIIVVRVAPPSDLYEVGNPDEFLMEYMNDIVTVVEQYQPNKIVFDELTPFVGFNNLSLLEDTFLRTTETIEDSGITSVFIIGEPATQGSKAVIDSLVSHTTGIIYLKKEESDVRKEHAGQITITPNIGHTEGKFTYPYSIEPYKGINVHFKEPAPIERIAPANTIPSKKGMKYKSLADIDIASESYSLSNFYDVNDFYLILNNQIALYKSTGQVFTIISFKLEEEAVKNGLLTVNQLANGIRLATDRKDKICIIANTVVLLVTKEDYRGLAGLIAKVKNNLPSSDPLFVAEVLKYISVYTVKVDDSINSADDLFLLLMNDEPQAKNKLDSY